MGAGASGSLPRREETTADSPPLTGLAALRAARGSRRSSGSLHSSGDGADGVWQPSRAAMAEVAVRSVVPHDAAARSVGDCSAVGGKPSVAVGGKPSVAVGGKPSEASTSKAAGEASLSLDDLPSDVLQEILAGIAASENPLALFQLSFCCRRLSEETHAHRESIKALLPLPQCIDNLIALNKTERSDAALRETLRSETLALFRSTLPAVRKLEASIVTYSSRGDRFENVWTIEKMIEHGLEMKQYIGFYESKMHGQFWFDPQIMALKMLMSQLCSDYPPPRMPDGPFQGNYMTPHD